MAEEAATALAKKQEAEKIALQMRINDEVKAAHDKQIADDKAAHEKNLAEERLAAEKELNDAKIAADKKIVEEILEILRSIKP